MRHNKISRADLPSAFEGFTILHLSDLHVDMNPVTMRRLTEVVEGLAYDVCVLTGDFRGQTAGPHLAALEGLEAGGWVSSLGWVTACWGITIRC